MTTTTPLSDSTSLPSPLPRTGTLGVIIGKLGPFIGLAMVVTLFGSLRPDTFLTLNNVQLMLLQTAVVGTAALGMTMIIVSGGIDLSVGANIAFTTVIVASLLDSGASPMVAAAGGVVAASLWGVLIGTLVTQLRLSPFIVTLGLWSMVRGVAKGWSGQTMVLAPQTWLNGLLRTLRPDERWMIFPPGVWLMIALAIVVALMLRYTRFGRHVFAIGSNELTARLCGVRVGRVKMLVYTLAAALAGVAGVLQFSYLTVGDPTTALGLELNIIAAVVIGGASLAGGEGSILGTLVGALIMTAVSNGCTKLGLANWVQEIVTGGIIILAVALDRWRHRSVS